MTGSTAALMVGGEGGGPPEVINFSTEGWNWSTGDAPNGMGYEYQEYGTYSPNPPVFKTKIVSMVASASVRSHGTSLTPPLALVEFQTPDLPKNAFFSVEYKHKNSGTVVGKFYSANAYFVPHTTDDSMAGGMNTSSWQWPWNKMLNEFDDYIVTFR
jgi:hypothetical protein